jgi:glutaredoxin 3
MKIELFITYSCPFCLRVLDFIDRELSEKKITIVDLLKDNEKSKFHLETTGRHTVPCLYINDNPLFESADIMDFLIKNKASY